MNKAPKSLSRRINGDLHLDFVSRMRYSLEALTDWIYSTFEATSMSRLKLDKQTILRLFGIGKGGCDASPMRIYIRYACLRLREMTEGHLLNIIDLGCGSGSYSDIFKKCLEGSVYYGIDLEYHPDWSELEKEVGPLKRIFHAINLAEYDISKIPQCDFTISFTVLEHVENLQIIMRKLYEISKSSSRHVHVVPSHASFLLCGSHGFRRFSPQSLDFLFREAGFKNINITPFGGLFSYLLYFLFRVNIVLRITKKFKLSWIQQICTSLYHQGIEKCIQLDQHVRILPICYMVEATKT